MLEHEPLESCTRDTMRVVVVSLVPVTHERFSNSLSWRRAWIAFLPEERSRREVRSYPTRKVQEGALQIDASLRVDRRRRCTFSWHYGRRCHLQEDCTCGQHAFFLTLVDTFHLRFASYQYTLFGLVRVLCRVAQPKTKRKTKQVFITFESDVSKARCLSHMSRGILEASEEQHMYTNPDGESDEYFLASFSPSTAV